MFKDKKVIVVGLARSGIHAAERLIEAGAIVTLNDSKETVEGIEHLKATLDLGGKPSHLDYDIMVLSPGVPTELDFVLKAKEKMTVIGALEVGYQLSEGTFYGITGTNGKTTTTTLIHEIFMADEKDAYAVGNIGQAVAAVAHKTTKDSHLITEVSSFQLESIQDFHVKIGAILNFTPDHLNRHKTMENYVDSKCRLGENQTSNDYMLLNYDNQGTRDVADRFKSQVIFFSKKPLEKGIFIENGFIVSNINGYEQLLSIDTIKLPGDHNLENVLAAVGVAYLAGISTEAIKEAVSRYTGVAHRIEYVGSIKGMKCYNDSKGTNPDSSIVAVKSMKAPTLLIAGGMDKGSEFDEFVQTFERVKHLILIGETKQIIADTAERYGYNRYTFVETMEEAVALAMKLGESGDIVLLSPACASWDMYSSYEVRGEHFKKCLEMY